MLCGGFGLLLAAQGLSVAVMHYSEIIRYASGLLQLGVAFYALRLGRLFNTARVGWLLFSALSILALANLLLPLNPFRGSLQMGVKVDIIYALASVLLIVAMAHFDWRFRKRSESESMEREAQSRWETQVQQRFEAATKGNEELQQIATKLQSDIAEHKQAQEQAERSHQEQLSASRLGEEELRQVITRLETQMTAQQQAEIQSREQTERTHQEQLAAAHQAGTTDALNELGSRVYSRLANLPANVDAAILATDDLSASRLSTIARIAKLLGEQAHEAMRLAKNGHPRARQLADRLTTSSMQLSSEQRLLHKKMQALEQQLALIKTAIQESYNEVAPAAGAELITAPADETVSLQVGDPAAASAQLDEATASAPEVAPVETVANAQEHLLSNVTQTATELHEPEPVTAPPAAAPEPVPEPQGVVETPTVTQFPRTNWPLPPLKLKMVESAPLQPDLGGKSA
jgi:hypothetical protein